MTPIIHRSLTASPPVVESGHGIRFRLASGGGHRRVGWRGGRLSRAWGRMGNRGDRCAVAARCLRVRAGGRKPGIQVIAKGHGGGYQPTGGILIGRKIIETLRRGSDHFLQGGTYQARPGACAAALAVQSVVGGGWAVANVSAMGAGPKLGLRDGSQIIRISVTSMAGAWSKLLKRSRSFAQDDVLVPPQGP